MVDIVVTVFLFSDNLPSSCIAFSANFKQKKATEKQSLFVCVDWSIYRTGNDTQSLK